MSHNNTLNGKTFSGFYKLSRAERLQKLEDNFDLNSEGLKLLESGGALPFDLSDLFVENSVGSFPMPFGIVTNILMDGQEHIAPFAVEESSVIAASSNACKWIKESGGFKTQDHGGMMIGQVQLLDVEPSKMEDLKALILENKSMIVSFCNDIHPRLVERGGGTRDLQVKSFPDAESPFIVIHLLMDTCEAMGANLINTTCEKVAPLIQTITGARIGLQILSNFASEKLYTTTCKVKTSLLSEKGMNNGDEIAQRIIEAYQFAKYDPHRAATHNKGIMNGIDPVIIATGNDWRANEAGIHAFACKEGRYQSLSTWKILEDGDLEGSLTVPMQLGTVGGITRLHPMAKFSLSLLNNPTSNQLALIAISTGLASNLAALRALVTTGIQAGHMKLHAKNIALAAGARGKRIDTVADTMIRENTISQSAAENILQKLISSDNSSQTATL